MCVVAMVCVVAMMRVEAMRCSAALTCVGGYGVCPVSRLGSCLFAMCRLFFPTAILFDVIANEYCPQPPQRVSMFCPQQKTVCSRKRVM